MNDNKFYGETEALDCPPNGGFCYKIDKYAVVGAISAEQDQLFHPPVLKKFPYYTIKKVFGSWDSRA